MTPLRSIWKRRRLCAAIALALAAGFALAGNAPEQTAFAPTIDLSTLNGADGFRMDGAGVRTNTGMSVAGVGDVNGDHIKDIAVSAFGRNAYAGSVFVVFGRTSAFPAAFDLSTLDGSNGFRIDGAVADDRTGYSIAGADFNGDGFSDVVVGSYPSADQSGATYVIIGHGGAFPASLPVTSLDGMNGFKITGAANVDHAGRSVARAGDVNGDGFDDLLIGAPTAQPGGLYAVGSAFVVFGHGAARPATMSLSALNGANGFRIDGVGLNDHFGQSVGGAVDVNGDGFGDLIVGARNASPGGKYHSGSSYVVFGHAAPFTATLAASTLNGGNGFRLDGYTAGCYAGWSVAGAGDVNGDGFGDVVVGQPATLATYPTYDLSGRAYVVFGHTGTFDATVALNSLNGANGFALDGPGTGPGSTGDAVAPAGDVNADGFADLMIGALGAVPHGGNSGSTYIVFGHGGAYPSEFPLGNLDGSNGFRLDGAVAGDLSGRGIAGVGDVNGDGGGDVLVGAFGADPHGVSYAGSAYVVFGLADRIFGNGFEGP